MTEFAAVILVDRRGWVLLQERDEHPTIAPEKWSFCGGHLESGEDPLAGAVRELEEETEVRLGPEALELVAVQELRHPETGTDDETIRNRLRLLAAVDEGVGQIFQTLEGARELDNTVIVFAGDNGYFYGEHCLSSERRLAYEESIRIPLLVRYPRAVKPRTVIDEFALNVDLAPTFLDLASAPAAPHMHGRSLRPLLGGRHSKWRESFLVEYFSDTVARRILNMGYQAVRTRRWKYIHYTELRGMDELYDLERDPYELDNLALRREADATVSEMQAELKRLRGQIA